MPLIRYRTRDVVKIADRPCPCGRTLFSVEGGVLGRLDDMKKIRGVIVYPRRIDEIVRQYDGVDEYQVVFKRIRGLDEIIVRIDLIYAPWITATPRCWTWRPVRLSAPGARENSFSPTFTGRRCP